MKNNLRSQAGMTLIELSVVLLILVGLAGLMLPYVSGFIAKTHNSTTVDTVAELNSTIQRYQSSKWALPNKLETLVDNTAGTTYNKLQSSQAGYSDLLGVLSGGPLTAASTSLNAAGISLAYGNNNLTSDATFNSTLGSALPITSTSTTSLAYLAGGTTSDNKLLTYGLIKNTGTPVQDQLIYAFGGDASTWDVACTNYVVMGIGSANSMIPAAMQSAPVHFSGTGAQSTALAYNRYVAVFAVPNSTTYCASAPSVATFVGSAMLMPFPAIVGLNGAQQYANSNILD